MDKDGLPIEEHRLGLVFAVEPKTTKHNYEGAPYYQVKKYLQLTLDALNIEAVLEPMTIREPKMEVDKAKASPFERARAAYVTSKDGKLLGVIGEFKPSVTSKFKLPAFAAGFELDVLQLLIQQAQKSSYTALPRFPKVEQDISLKVPADKIYVQIFSMVYGQIDKLKPQNSKFNLTPVDIYQEAENKEYRHITLHLKIASHNRTLTADEVNSLLDKVSTVAQKKLGAERL